jgi:hypothetical protein
MKWWAGLMSCGFAPIWITGKSGSSTFHQSCIAKIRNNPLGLFKQIEQDFELEKVLGLETSGICESSPG